MATPRDRVQVNDALLFLCIGRSKGRYLDASKAQTDAGDDCSEAEEQQAHPLG